jgi:hypothetical protein
VTPSEAVYQSSEIYPSHSFTYSTSTGLLGAEHMVFLSVTVYPIRYSPLENTLFISEKYFIKNAIETYNVSSIESIESSVLSCDGIVDAIFGTGLERDVSGIYKDVIQLINGSKKKVWPVERFVELVRQIKKPDTSRIFVVLGPAEGPEVQKAFDRALPYKALEWSGHQGPCGL